MLIFCVIPVLSACQSDNAGQASLPTLVRFPTITATPPASQTPEFTNVSQSLSATMIVTNTVTALPAATERLHEFPTETITSTIPPTVTVTATLLPETFVFGESVNGQALLAYRYGTGHTIIMLVGGIHAGFEANTIDLMFEVQRFLQNNPSRIDPEVSFIVVPVLNPDGQQRGRVISGRFNANGVDLNRNWGCGWSEEAFFRDERVDAGDEAFSEPETLALGSLIQRINPGVVIFYHAAANGVFAGNCGGNSIDSEGLAAIYGEASGYPYGADFDEYPVTGTAPGWVNSTGIPALDVELSSADSSEFDRNMRALIAIQAWVKNP